MQDKINEILDDLYRLDPSFQTHEEKLKQIIHKLIEAKPETKFDYQFAQTLKAKLLRDTKTSFAEEVKEIKYSLTKRLSWAIGIAAVCLVLVATTLYVNDQNGNQLSFFSPGVKITSAGERAFGELDEVTVTNAQARDGDTANTALSDSAPAFAKEAALPSMLYPPEYVTYRYVYSGEEIVLEDAKREVLKRITGYDQVGDLSAMVSSLNFGLVNLGSFGNLNIQSINLQENVKNGYYISIDVKNGNINIGGHWPDYPVALEIVCFMEFCPPAPPALLKESEVPPDEKIIEVADRFAQDHQISVASYGQPVVQDDWKIRLANAADKANFYIPEVIIVVYPLIVNEKIILTESGLKAGISMAVNIRSMEVTSVYDLTTQNYQSSMYEAETDVTRILKIAQSGGVYGYFDSSAKAIDVQLGTPQLEYVKMYNYRNNEPEELLIPSLVFPVQKQPTESVYWYYRSNVVVPLIKEILERNDML